MNKSGQAMMICPECKAEYRSGFSECAVCDVLLVPQSNGSSEITEKVSDTNPTREDDVLLDLYRGKLGLIKELKQLLEEHSIPALYFAESSRGG